MDNLDAPILMQLAKMVSENPQAAAKVMAQSGLDPDVVFQMGQPSLGALAGGEDMQGYGTLPMGRLPGQGGATTPGGPATAIAPGQAGGGNTGPASFATPGMAQPQPAPAGGQQVPTGGVLPGGMGAFPQPVGLPPIGAMPMSGAQPQPAPMDPLGPAGAMPQPAPAGGQPGMIGPWDTTVTPAGATGGGMDPNMALLQAGLRAAGVGGGADQRPIFGPAAPNPGFNPRPIAQPQGLAMLQQLFAGGGMPPSLGALMR